MLRSRLYADKCCADINGQHAIEVFETVDIDRSPDQNSCIVDENIQFTQLSCDLINCCANVLGRGAIRFNRERLASRSFYFACDPRCFFFRAGNM